MNTILDLYYFNIGKNYRYIVKDSIYMFSESESE